MTEFARLQCSRCSQTYRQDLVYTNPNDGQYWCDQCYAASEWAACHDCEFWFRRVEMHEALKTGTASTGRSATQIQMCTSCRNQRIMRRRRFSD